MRNYLEILEDIKSILLKNAFYKEQKKLNFAILAGSTGGEIFSDCGHLLMVFQNENKHLEFLLEKLIKEYMSLSVHYGIYFKK